MPSFDFNYDPSPTFKQFHRDGCNIRPMLVDSKTGVVLDPGENYVRCVMGPIGSGKTVGCVAELFFQCITQWKNPADNIRRSRIAIVRDTYKNLNNTTLTTFLQWFPEGVISKVKWTPPIEIKWDFWIGKDDRVQVEFICIALDSPTAIEDLKSLEISGAFVNECVSIDPDAINMLIQRVGRYPGGNVDPDKKTRSFVIMDTNPPNVGNWYQQYKDEIKPPAWKFYDQPPALFYEKDADTGKYKFYPNVGQREGIYSAENIRFLKEGYGYYMKAVHTADPSYVLVYMCMRYGEVGNGTVVYSTYDDAVHCANAALPFNPTLPLILGFDYGLTPACVFAQFNRNGQLQVIDELFKKGIGQEQFLDQFVIPKLINDYGWLKHHVELIAVGDPAGNKRMDTDESTCMDLLNRKNIPVVACATNAILPRLESVRYFLNTMAGGQPAFKLSPRCEMLRRGFQGLYKFELVRGETVRLRDEPTKNDYSHAHDALQYICHRIRFASDYAGGQSLFKSSGEVAARREHRMMTHGTVDMGIV